LEMERPSSIHNVEWVESNFPLLHLFRRHVRDGAGGGKFRGGAGEETAFIVHDAPEEQVRIVALGVAGLSNSGHGADGGYPGAPSVLVHMKDTTARDVLASGRLATDPAQFGGQSRFLPYCSVDLKARDVLYLRCGSGGGYGDPLERDPKAVQADVVNALISPETAEGVYGVVIGSDRAVDRAATVRVRESLRARRAPSGRLAKPQQQEKLVSRHRVQEHVEACSDGDAKWLRCTGCGHRFGAPDTDWLAGCETREFEPTTAGPLMDLLAHEFKLRQWYCPGCGVLLRTEMVASGGAHGHDHSHAH
jgi:N-methylhydantoinase B